MAYPSIAKFFPLSSITKLYSVDSIEEKYSRETFEALDLKEMLPLQEEFVEQVLNPRKDENDYWETWYLRLSLIQKTTFIGILIIGYYNIEGAKFLKSKKVIMINPQLQFSIGLFPLITITKEVVKSTWIYKKKRFSEAQSRKQFFMETRSRKLTEAFLEKA